MSSLTGSRGATGNKIPKGYAAGKLQQYGPEQMELFKRLFSYSGPQSQLAQRAAGSQAGFEPQEELARRGFQEFQGQLGSRFSELAPGAMSARRGSGFQNAATQGAQDFALQLAGQRQQLQQQALADLLGISQTLLGAQPSQNFLIQKQQKPPKQSFWSKLFGTAAPLAGAGLGAVFGGPAGAALGGSIGSSLASGFQPTQY